jgi:cytochrome d ubiquinol oxidase subunit I
MDVEILARVQFAVTIMFHYIYPPLSIGLGLILVIIEGMYIKTGNPLYLDSAKFWTKIFALTFAIGVATGIVMEFEFGTNWATYSRYVGDVFGSALAAEGIFAFFLESGFLALVLFGWNRVSPKVHYFATIMVCLGAHFSAIWIVVANSWMQTPAGFEIVGDGLEARAIITDFWAMVFNPSSMTRLMHTVIGAWLAGAFLVISISAYYLLKKRHEDFAKSSLKVGLTVAMIATVLQAITGHKSDLVVAEHQPAKLAAFEAVFETKKEAPLSLGGIPNVKEKRLDYAIEVPYLLSILVGMDPQTEIKGLNEFPEKDWPVVGAVFQTYHLMIYMWGIMFVLCLLGVWFWYRGTLFEKRWLKWAFVFSVLCPQIANQAGWVSAEMGRYPWIVQDLLRISEGLSKNVVASQVLGSLIMFSVVYSLLFILFIYLLNEKIQHGPSQSKVSKEYHNLHKYIEEV